MSLPVWPSAFIRLAVGYVLGVGHLARTSEPGAVSAGWPLLQSGALLVCSAHTSPSDPRRPIVFLSARIDDLQLDRGDADNSAI
jgi:hypothetical protein